MKIMKEWKKNMTEKYIVTGRRQNMIRMNAQNQILIKTKSLLGKNLTNLNERGGGDKMKNFLAEYFFLNVLPKKEDLDYSKCAEYLSTYYLEKEKEDVFNSKDFKNQRERAEKMFEGLTERALNFMEYVFLLHRKKHHGEDSQNERISELKKIVPFEYKIFTVFSWWRW